MNTRIKMTLGFVTLTLCSALAGCAADGEVAADDVAEVQQAVGCASACGTSMANVDGVHAYSNGSKQRTGEGCGLTNTRHGIQYQCVEYARRYWDIKWGILLPQPLIPGRTFTAACDLCNVPPNGWIRYTGSLPAPKKGDLFVKPCVNGSVGHVGVVESASNGQVTIVEQNDSCNGRSTYPLSAASCLLRPVSACYPNCS